jgi:prenyl protein peptidase
MPVPLIIHAAQVIPTKIAHLLVASFAFSYVGSLYIFKNGRLSFASNAKPTRNGEARRKRWNERWRDDPDVIKARLASVILATLVCCIGVSAVLWYSVYRGNVVS